MRADKTMQSDETERGWRCGAMAMGAARWAPTKNHGEFTLVKRDARAHGHARACVCRVPLGSDGEAEDVGGATEPDDNER